VVVDQRTEDEADRLFQALADTTRRDILRRCVGGEPSVSALAGVYPMSFAAVQKHVAVLERAGLVVKERRGREQLVRTDVVAVGTGSSSSPSSTRRSSACGSSGAIRGSSSGGGARRRTRPRSSATISWRAARWRTS
jgi:DNA-binding transcriptional ArsR family regulator